MTTLTDLRAEYEAERIGARILTYVGAAVSRIVQRYPPEVYSETRAWDRLAIENTTQEVILETLLEEHQLDYLFDVAVAIEDFDRLLARQIRRTLARHRVRTVIDNLLPRAMQQLDTDARVVKVGGSGGDSVFVRRSSPRSNRAPTDGELRRAALAARAVPHLSDHAGSRASQVYSTEQLRVVLDRVLDSLPTPVGRSSLQKIFELVLTDWVPRLLDEDESVEVLEEDLNPQQRAEVNSTVAHLLTLLDNSQRRIFVAKREGVTDTELAEELGLSRPTAAKQKAAVYQVIAGACEALDHESARATVDELYLQLLAGRDGQ